MRHLLGLVALAVASAIEAQVAPPRSSTYLFSAEVDDARAIWLNPAGLGVLPIASIYAEMGMDRATVPPDWGLRQYSFGLHSRNLAFGYQRDRPVGAASMGVWRVGAAFPLGRRFALGTGVTFTSPERGTDVGLRISPVRMLDVGLVLRDIGRPVVRGAKRYLSGIGGFSWKLAEGKVGIQTDAIATERPTSGWDLRYRAGASLFIPAKAPFTLLTAVDLDDGRIDRWSLGIGIGYAAQALMVGTVPRETGGSGGVQAFSVTGVGRGRTTRRE